MKTTTDRAKELRAAYKARGWNSRQISVRTHNYSMGSSINVTIKAGCIPKCVAEEIASEYESIRRCEYSGEILSGGNRFVFVNLNNIAELEKAAPYMTAVRDAISKLPEDPSNALVHIGNIEGAHVGCAHPGQYQLWFGNGLAADMQPDAHYIALRLALEIEKAGHNGRKVDEVPTMAEPDWSDGHSIPRKARRSQHPEKGRRQWKQ
jgi:hypothetical protein